MKRILGAAAGALLWVSGCGDDASSVENQATAGKNASASGAAGDTSALGGDGGQSVTAPVGGGAGGNTDEGGAPTELAGAGTGGAGGSAETPSTVSGHITSFLGSPLANVVVIIDDASTVTDEHGAFTIADVPASYDLTAIDNERKIVQVVEGLTTREPRLGLWLTRLTGRSGGIAGKLSGGGGFPLPAGQAGVVSFRGKRSGFSEVNVAASASSFSLSNVSWEGELTHAGLLTGIFWKTGVTGPLEYTGYARRSLLIEADKTVGNVNGTFAATNLELIDPAEHTITGTLAVAGLPLLTSYLQVGGDSVPLNLAPGPISLVVPKVEAPTSVLVAADLAVLGSSSVEVPISGSTSLEVELPSLPQLILPVPEAVGITQATEFSWKAPPQGTYSLVSWSMGEWTAVRVTAESKVRLPDLSAAGVVYAEGDHRSSWELQQRSPASSAEEALELFDGSSPSYGTVVTTYRSAGREFQLAD